MPSRNWLKFESTQNPEEVFLLKMEYPLIKAID
jgi:hypothetical protein